MIIDRIASAPIIHDPPPLRLVHDTAPGWASVPRQRSFFVIPPLIAFALVSAVMVWAFAYHPMAVPALDVAKPVSTGAAPVDPSPSIGLAEALTASGPTAAEQAALARMAAWYSQSEIPMRKPRSPAHARP